MVAFTGGGSAAPRNTGRMFVALKPLDERKLSADQVIDAAARPSSPACPGADLFLQAVQDLRIGGRASNAQYQYTLQSDEPGRARTPGRRRCSARLREAAASCVDVSSDQQNSGLQASLVIDRDTASRLGIPPQADRRHALRRLRAAPGLDHLHAAQPVPRGAGGRAAVLAEPGRAQGHLRPLGVTVRQVPLSDRSHATSPAPRRWRSTTRASSPSVTLSFNLAPGVALGRRGRRAIQKRRARDRHAGARAGRASRAPPRRSRRRWRTSRC